MRKATLAGAAGRKASIEACVASGRIRSWARPRDARSSMVASVSGTTSWSIWVCHLLDYGTCAPVSRKPLKKTDRRTAIAIHNSESSGLTFCVEHLEKGTANGYAMNQFQPIFIKLT